MTYELKKRIWTEADFDRMGWHDCTIYKVRLAEDLEMDIDYILQWNEPETDGFPFTYWVSPATLVFKKIKDLSFEFDATSMEPIEIEDIEQEIDDDGKTRWTIITQQGDVEFTCESFEQYIRQEPFCQLSPAISMRERNGFSLERTTNQANPQRLNINF
jgi:hypothetical protein